MAQEFSQPPVGLVFRVSEKDRSRRRFEPAFIDQARASRHSPECGSAVIPRMRYQGYPDRWKRRKQRHSGRARQVSHHRNAVPARGCRYHNSGMPGGE